jgi:iron complex transport system ATP-binding protein
MLRLENVSVGYGGADLVKNISFEAKENEIIVIIGPNGCGKTTLLRAIAGLLPYSGIIKISGLDTREMKQREIARKIAMLDQQGEGIYFPYTVYDTVMMGRYVLVKDRLLGMPSGEDRDAVLNCLESVNLLDARDREITKLSGGQLQRVFLARTLAQEPSIILLDEPTNHLDLKYQSELTSFLREWAKRGGRAVIGVMHDLSLAARLASDGKILVMKDGTCRAFGETGEVIREELLRDVYAMDVAAYMAESFKIWDNIKNFGASQTNK